MEAIVSQTTWMRPIKSTILTKNMLRYKISHKE